MRQNASDNAGQRSNYPPSTRVWQDTVVGRWKPGPHVSHGYKRIATSGLAAEFHVWGREFTPQRINYYFDGRLVQSLDATVIPHGPQNIWLTSVAAPLGGG